MGMIQRSRFSTLYLPPEDRFAAWQASIGTIFDVTPSAGMSLDAFHARLDSYLIGGQLMLARCETSAQRFERNALRVARDDLDYYLVQTHISGTQDLHRGSKEHRSATGDLLVLDLADGHRAQTTNFCNLTLVIPRHMLAPKLIHPDSQQGRVLKGGETLTQLAVNHIQMLFEIIGMLTMEEAVRTIEPAMQLLASALNGSIESVDKGEGSVAASLLRQAKLEIERNLHRHFPVDALCGVLSVSRATLHRLFEPVGGVHAYIRDRRLRRAARALLAPHNTRHRIDEIACAWGFASETDFTRAFRHKFGVSPREARLVHNLMRREEIALSPTAVGDRLYETWLAETLKG